MGKCAQLPSPGFIGNKWAEWDGSCASGNDEVSLDKKLEYYGLMLEC